jgi:hypothetical protein
MAESKKPSRALHDGRLTPEVISAALGSFPASAAVPTPTPIAAHGHTLQCLIAFIKNRKSGPRA